MKGKMGLGKGLGALLPASEELANYGKEYFVCPVEAIRANPLQPRKKIKNQELAELAASIGEKGVLQPLVVRKRGDVYELIAGERRWQAAQLAGLKEVPVVVKDVSSAESLEIAIIENVQRQDLNPLEEAGAYERLMLEFKLNQEEVAKRVGKERSTVANYLRLVNLPDFAKEDLINEVLTMGHARVLLGLEDAKLQKEVRDQVVTLGLSVRQCEALAKKVRRKSHVKRTSTTDKGLLPDSYRQALINELMRYLGVKVDIVQKGSRGKIEIEYYSAADLERLLGLIMKE